LIYFQQYWNSSPSIPVIMSSPHSDSYDSHTRKRVGKACDRCRLKKSKCDGSSPCNRCKVDNAICVFGERKKSHDKVYPKGYVEMLEQQQSQLVAGVRQMYRKLLNGEKWPGSALPEQQEGFPLTHDILERLDVLHMTGENPVGSEAFEDDLEKLQNHLVESGASYVPRRSSPGTESEPDLSHAESPISSHAMSRSSVSTTSSRKRSSPATPQPPQRDDQSIPAKRRNFVGVGIQGMDMEPLFFSEPLVMSSPGFSEPSIDYPIYTSYDSNNASMFDNLNLNVNTIQNLGSMSGVQIDTWSQDPDFDSFMQSGYHGTMV